MTGATAKRYEEEEEEEEDDDDEPVAPDDDESLVADFLDESAAFFVSLSDDASAADVFCSDFSEGEESPPSLPLRA